MAHELWIVKETTITEITMLVGSINRRSNKDELGEEISFDVALNDVKHFPENPCKLGDIVVLKNNREELTRAVIVEEDRKGWDPVVYKAFDFAFYLNKSNAIYQFKKMAADKCIKKIANDFGVKIGKIASMKTKITKIFNDETVSDIIKEIIKKHERVEDNKYLMEMRQGKLHIEKQKDLKITSKFKLNGKTFNAMEAISEPSHSLSIDSMINAIQVVGNDDKLEHTAEDTKMIEKYGKLQSVITLDQDEKKSAKQMAKKELKKLSKVTEDVNITLIGDDKVRAGRILEVKEPITGIKGDFMINDVEHTIEGGIHTMKLGLEAE